MHRESQDQRSTLHTLTNQVTTINTSLEGFNASFEGREAFLAPQEGRENREDNGRPKDTTYAHTKTPRVIWRVR